MGRNGKEIDFPLEPPQELSPDDPWILAHWDLCSASDLTQCVLFYAMKCAVVVIASKTCVRLVVRLPDPMVALFNFLRTFWIFQKQLNHFHCYQQCVQFPWSNFFTVVFVLFYSSLPIWKSLSLYVLIWWVIIVILFFSSLDMISFSSLKIFLKSHLSFVPKKPNVRDSLGTVLLTASFLVYGHYFLVFFSPFLINSCRVLANLNIVMW